MKILDGLATRRSVYHFSDESPDLALVGAALDAAVLAPNHHKTKPWRFVVFSGKGRERLSEAFGLAAERLGRPVDRARSKPFTSPVQVLVGARPQLDNPKVLVQEEYLAVGAAVQNFMLALHAHGVGSIWTTGALPGSDEVKQLVGWLDSEDQVIGMVYVGFPEGEKAIPERAPASHESFTTWIA